MADEQVRLLDPNNAQTLASRPQRHEDQGSRSHIEVLPAPLITSAGIHSTVSCQVCQALLNLEGRMDQFVAKCSQCGEATPIRAAPPGKKYIRCPCNCLLICKSTSLRVACPRPNCRRVISINDSDTQLPGGEALGDSLNVRSNTTCEYNVNVMCARCGSPFIITAIMGKSLGMARCPHCRQLSSVGPGYARIRWMAFGAFTLIMFIAAIATTIGTVSIAQNSHGLYALWAALYLLAIFLFIRCVQFLCMPISMVEYSGTMNS
jgi:phosphatidylinositol-4,5-bisphosphate 4-phosphatase